jgi:4,5-dihydroxyphthalate decarboxylase
MGTYAHTRPLKDGRVSSPRLQLEQVEVVPANRAFRPMVNQLAYDVSELALVTLLLARAANRPLVGVPVVLMQQSAYGMFAVTQDSPLRDPRQLAGCRLGVRAYTQTTGVWLRGMLADQFGLDLDSLSWLTLEPAHVDGLEDPPNAQRAPNGANLVDLLRSGQIQAAAGIELADYPDLRTLIPDAERVENDWILHTGIRPINHTLVARQDVVAANPWVIAELDHLVRASKQVAGTARRSGSKSRCAGAAGALYV